MYCYRLEKNKV